MPNIDVHVLNTMVVVHVPFEHGQYEFHAHLSDTKSHAVFAGEEFDLMIEHISRETDLSNPIADRICLYAYRLPERNSVFIKLDELVTIIDGEPTI